MGRRLVPVGPWRAVATELGAGLVTLAGAGTLVFTLVVLAPGDPIDLLPNTEAVRPVLEARWGLDQPIPVRIGRWWAAALSGDLGTSLALRPGMPVRTLVAPALLASMIRIAAAMALATALAAAAALWARPHGSTRGFVLVASVPPVFLLAHFGVYAANETTWAMVQNGWIQRPDWFALPDQASMVREALAIGCLAIGSGMLASLHQELAGATHRWRRSALAEAIRARGDRAWPSMVHHMVPPTLEAIGARVAALTGGVLVVEKLLLMPGAGSMLWNASLERDAEVVLAIAVAAAGWVVVVRSATQLARIAVDPRLRRAP